MSKLYIIGSPIGNLEDITIRAVDILKNLEYVFSEDTRISSKLMKKFDINTSLLPIYTSKKELNKNKFLDLIRISDIGFLTDAGSPGVSDPAGEFVKIARNNNHEIIPIPGVSSVTSAFSVSGLESIGFSFLGFLGLILICVLIIQIYLINDNKESFLAENAKVLAEGERDYLHSQKKYWGIRSQGIGAGVLVGKPGMNDWFKFCLLYTSPSPRDGLLSRMPSSA